MKLLQRYPDSSSKRKFLLGFLFAKSKSRFFILDSKQRKEEEKEKEKNYQLSS
jgi:hypothetical protein